MADRSAYERLARLALSSIAAGDDPLAAPVARARLGGLPSSTGQPHRPVGRSLSERLERARAAVCAPRYDRYAFEECIIGIEECAEKRYLMAVAAFRAANGSAVPLTAVEDLTRAMQLDPGNAEYIAFAELLANHLEDQDLRRAIANERAFIRKLKFRGVSERGRWV